MAAVQANKEARTLSPRGERTRAKLIAAARQTFEADGFVEARIADIAERAGLAVGSFYTYFDSKDAIFRAVADAVAEELVAPLPAEVGKGGFARIEAGNRAYVRTYRANARLFAILQHRTFEDRGLHELRQRGRQVFIDRAERAIRRLQSEGEVAKSVQPKFAATALSCMVHSFCYEAFSFDDELFDEEETVRGLTLLWAQALGLRIPSTAARKGTRG